MNAIAITTGDKGYDIVVTVKDAEGTLVDLTSATAVTFKVVDADTHRNFLNASGVIDAPATLGKVRYTVLADDFKKEGNYRGVVTIEFGATKTITSKSFFITAKKSFGT